MSFIKSMSIRRGGCEHGLRSADGPCHTKTQYICSACLKFVCVRHRKQHLTKEHGQKLTA